MRYSIYNRRLGLRIRPNEYWDEWLKQTRMGLPYQGNNYEHAAKMRARNLQDAAEEYWQNLV